MIIILLPPNMSNDIVVVVIAKVANDKFLYVPVITQRHAREALIKQSENFYIRIAKLGL
jgi:uncharacterized protein YifN (PemK superfamily)